VTVAGKRTSRHVTVAWRKRKRLRKNRTQENCETACRKVSRHATVAWRKRNITRKIRIQVNSESSKEFAADGMRKSPEGNDGIRHRDVKKLPHLRKERRTTNGIKEWRAVQRSHPGSGETPKKTHIRFSKGRSQNKSSELLVGYEE
jgi:hypothetical protein